MVGAFASGRILNPRTAHSQYMGGMIWGVGSAIHEQTEIDPRTSRYVNANLADYMIPVNADIGEVHIIMVPEEDTVINPLGIKGIGEIGIVGTSAALANAIYHATGQRLRDLPLRIDSLVSGVLKMMRGSGSHSQSGIVHLNLTNALSDRFLREGDGRS